VLAVLVANRGRVVARRDLALRAGMANLSERRCDSALVGLRRALGPDAIVTVRSRGWRLHEESFPEALRLLDDDQPPLSSTG
jgi:DNA-binding response OmpR family regulator